ncbi:hypothetical protein ACFLX3_01380 [Chloroflexota bacterium]
MKRVIIRRVRTGARGVPMMKARGIPTAGNRQPGLKLIDNQTLNKFNPAMLGLGDISSPSQEIEAVAAVFDLSGFTKFCTQVDGHLAVPKFLNDFLEWFFRRIRIGLTKENCGSRSSFWLDLPILVKFLGDGILLLWNARGMTENQICKIVSILHDTCYDYKHHFYPQISRMVVKPPSVLRCGVARGRVFSVGNGRDYVGHCINNASRLVQLRVLSFCFPHRGFPVQEYMPTEHFRLFVQKCLPIRGVGEEELVWVAKEEFDNLPEESQGLFSDPAASY